MRGRICKKRGNLARLSQVKTIDAWREKGILSISNATRIYVNESLTCYRNNFFRCIHEFKKANKFKFLWTAGRKIHLYEMETSSVYKLKTHKQFGNFLEAQGYYIDFLILSDTLCC